MIKNVLRTLVFSVLGMSAATVFAGGNHAPKPNVSWMNPSSVVSIPETVQLPYDVKKPAWFGGFEVTTFAQIPGFAGGSGPNAPVAEYPNVTAYLVGNINDGMPFGAQVDIPQIDPATGQPVIVNGQPVIVASVPAHDDVFTAFLTRPFNGFGKWVVAGPNATARNVHTRPMPAGSIAGAPLVYEIQIGNLNFYLPLTSNAAVEYGLRTGQLAVVDAGWGGVAWLAFRQHAY